MKNTLTDLYDLLYEEIEVLSNPDLKGRRLEMEMKRAKAMADAAVQAVAIGNLMLKAAVVADGFTNPKSLLPRIMMEE